MRFDEIDSPREIKLKPTLRRKLLNELKLYQELKVQLKTIEYALDKHKAAIGELRDETGEQSISLDGFSVTLVAPMRKKFDPNSEWGGLELYKEYNKISCPGDRSEANGD